MTTRNPPTEPAGPLRAGRRAAAVVAIAGVTLAACGADGDVITVTATPTDSTSAPVTEAPPDPADTTTTTDPDDISDAGVSTTTVEPPPTTPGEVAIVEPALFVDVPIEDVADLGGDKPSRPYDDFVGVAFTDIERWLEQVYPEIYGDEFSPLEGGVYVGYPERESPIPGCGEDETDYSDLQLFVAFYCQDGDFMAYDDGDGRTEFAESILAPLAQDFGAAVMGVVLAHEYAHAIQARIGALDRFLATIITEQQADCFAGAWTGQAYRGESPLLRLGDRDVRAGLLAMLSVRDPVGTDQFDPGGHGSAFDRVGAFQEGFLNGPERCAPLLDEPLPLVPNEFRSFDDAQRGGNASYDCRDDPDPDCTPAPLFLADDLNHYWGTLIENFVPVVARPVDDLALATCSDGYALTVLAVVCPSSRTLFFDEPLVRELYFDFGDFSIGYLYGIGWAEFAQRDIGSGVGGEQRALFNDCLTGAWVRDITPDPNGATPRGGRDEDGDGVLEGVVSSPGDLDEAIRMVILLGDEGAGVDAIGSPFEKIDAIRSGALTGLEGCDAFVG